MKIFIFLVLTVNFITNFVSSSRIKGNGNGQNWAVLVSGSNKFYNYVDQANVCHAFHDMVAHGIPESNIIVMMYDDIANNPENPYPGIIINQPNGSDLYHGVIKDYVGDDVNPQTFMKVLLGDPELKSQGKKVLESGPDDNVFIYFSNHGGSLVILFPNDMLSARDLMSTLNQMHTKQMYNNMLFYLDTCESGSMFEGILPDNISIYATTSASSTEPAWNCFCETTIVACIASEYSFGWTVDSDPGKDFGNETVEQQFLLVRNETLTSTAHEFGDLSIGKMTLSSFLIHLPNQIL